MTDKKKIFIIAAIAVGLIALTPMNTAAAESFIIKEEVGAQSQPYLTAIPDAKGKWQIGFGSTWNYDAGRWVQQGDTINSSQAYRFMRSEIAEKVQLLNNVVKVTITPNMKTALLSLAYNIGSTAFAGSTLLKLLNAGAPKATVAEEFQYWRLANGAVSPGLVARRAREKQLFIS